ncbi:TPA: hypothetical protein ACH3X2_002484 [Trebouxia sp. C0005]
MGVAMSHSIRHGRSVPPDLLTQSSPCQHKAAATDNISQTLCPCSLAAFAAAALRQAAAGQQPRLASIKAEYTYKYADDCLFAAAVNLRHRDGLFCQQCQLAAAVVTRAAQKGWTHHQHACKKAAGTVA